MKEKLFVAACGPHMPGLEELTAEFNTSRRNYPASLTGSLTAEPFDHSVRVFLLLSSAGAVVGFVRFDYDSTIPAGEGFFWYKKEGAATADFRKAVVALLKWLFASQVVLAISFFVTGAPWKRLYKVLQRECPAIEQTGVRPFYSRMGAHIMEADTYCIRGDVFLAWEAARES